MKKLIKSIIIASILFAGATGASVSAAEKGPQKVILDPGTGGSGGK
ncbi:hypothetical protein RGU11_06640 [Rossellomorea marisflavi]|jgi:hypothetical protein|nr:hypothetical protein [Rossellomorea marisflavi]MDR4936043.1 hypothetical protein [Rossellomorea marisflavi]